MKLSKIKRRLARDAKFGRPPSVVLEEARPTVTESALEKLVKDPPKTAKGRRAVRIYQPQVHEPTKDVLFLRGVTLSLVGQRMLLDLSKALKPYIKVLRAKQHRMMEPWKSVKEFEYLGFKNKCPIVCFACSTQTKPLRLFIARMFNWKMFDQLEFDVVKYKPAIRHCKRAVAEGAKPIVLFQGSHWNASPEMERAKNSLADLFGGIKAKKVVLDNFSRAITCTAYERIAPMSEASEIVIDICYWVINLYKDLEGNSSLPQVNLTYCGPKLLLKIKQARFPDEETLKDAMRIPNEDFVKGKSSVKTTTNDLKETRQTIHVEKEKMNTLNLRHGKD